MNIPHAATPHVSDYAEPQDAARAYERTLKNFFTGLWPCFNLVLLGLGADGHTASLFLGSPALEERQRWVVAVRGPAEPRVRLTPDKTEAIRAVQDARRTAEVGSSLSTSHLTACGGENS